MNNIEQTYEIRLPILIGGLVQDVSYSAIGNGVLNVLESRAGMNEHPIMMETNTVYIAGYTSEFELYYRDVVLLLNVMYRATRWPDTVHRQASASHRSEC